MRQKSGDVIAILISDIHLSQDPPIARAGEPDWFAAMSRPLREVRRLARGHGDAPVLCAGDVFHNWKASPELINFAIDELPTMFAIPGQHDLPMHNLDLIAKSAYWTLVKTGKIFNVPPSGMLAGAAATSRLSLYGYPWGVPFTPPPAAMAADQIQVALIHEYTWLNGASAYDGAPMAAKLLKTNPYDNCDVVVIGDNHIAWDAVYPKIDAQKRTSVMNVGGFMRRNADQEKHRPRIGLLHANGDLSTHYLDTRDEVFCSTTVEPKAKSHDPRIKAFLKELNDLHGTALDFAEALKRFTRAGGVGKDAIRLIEEALEHGDRR